MHRLAIPVASVFIAVLALGCSDSQPTSTGLTAPAHASQSAVDGADFGFTDGWFEGRTVQFSYHKPFFCGQPAEDGLPIGSANGCEVGVDGEVDPRGGGIPELWVMTPMGFTPPAGTLQCPVAGNCINHPSTVDLSRVLGPGSANVPLPAHSHIIDDRQGNWWETLVIGVKDLATWNQIVAGKSIETVRALQAADPSHTHITADIESNIYIFFSVRP
jgi:hypothetical protein